MPFIWFVFTKTQTHRYGFTNGQKKTPSPFRVRASVWGWYCGLANTKCDLVFLEHRFRASFATEFVDLPACDGRVILDSLVQRLRPLERIRDCLQFFGRLAVAATVTISFHVRLLLRRYHEHFAVLLHELHLLRRCFAGCAVRLRRSRCLASLRRLRRRYLRNRICNRVCYECVQLCLCECDVSCHDFFLLSCVLRAPRCAVRNLCAVLAERHDDNTTAKKMVKLRKISIFWCLGVLKTSKMRDFSILPIALSPTHQPQKYCDNSVIASSILPS